MVTGLDVNNLKYASTLIEDMVIAAGIEAFSVEGAMEDVVEALEVRWTISCHACNEGAVAITAVFT